MALGMMGGLFSQASANNYWSREQQAQNTIHTRASISSHALDALAYGLRASANPYMATFKQKLQHETNEWLGSW